MGGEGEGVLDGDAPERERSDETCVSVGGLNAPPGMQQERATYIAFPGLLTYCCLISLDTVDWERPLPLLACFDFAIAVFWFML